MSIELRQKRAARVAVGVALGLALAKIGAGLLVNSVAILASAVDSLLDAFASFMNLLAIRIAHAPPDEEHRYGHTKAESLATAGQGLLIGGSSVYLFIEGAKRILAPEPWNAPAVGLGTMAAAALASAGLVAYMRRVARQTGSSALEADAAHYATDVLANLAVLAGVVVVWLTGLQFLDGALTLGVALYVGASAFGLLRGATRVLMDEEIPREDRERIVRAIHPFLGRVRSYHGLRTRSAGQRYFVELHLEMDGDVALRDAHALGVEVEEAIRSAVPSSQVLIHLDVEEDEPS